MQSHNNPFHKNFMFYLSVQTVIKNTGTTAKGLKNRCEFSKKDLRDFSRG